MPKIGSHLVEESVHRRARHGASTPLRISEELTAVPSIGPADRPQYLVCKRAIDVLLACVLLVVAAPVIVLLALLIKLTSRGPAFYTQTRVGRQGRLFTIYKLRTMIHECESLTGPRWAIPG